MSGVVPRKLDRDFALLFVVMLTIAAGNTALQSVLPAIGRSLGVKDNAVAAAFSVSALLWVVAAPIWANRSDRSGRRSMILLGVGGFSVSLTLCGVFLLAGINGWISGLAAFLLFIIGRLIYGTLGAAAPPAVQAIVAGRTTRAERTKALTLLGSAFGLGTILGPAIAPYLLLGHLGQIEVGLSGPAFLFALFGAAMFVTVRLRLPDDRTEAAMDDPAAHGAANAYPSIGGQSWGASSPAATSPRVRRTLSFRPRNLLALLWDWVKPFLDPRIRSWMIAGLVFGHAQAMTGQAIGFLVIDRMHLPPVEALQPTGLVLMMGAGAALLVQWGIIPLLNLTPRAMMLVGLAIGAGWLALTGISTTLYGIAMAYALSSVGFGFARPAFTAGSSLAVTHDEQGAVAGQVTSVNGASFVLGPSIGVALYEVQHSLPYLTAAAACVVLLAYCWAVLKPSREPSREL